ncbi:hypothetical protein [Halopiger thermotolerans]
MTDDGAVTPRVLVRYTFYEPDGDEVRRVAFDAIQPQGTVADQRFVDLDVIGYAEFEPYTKVDRYRGLEEFRDHIESKAEYVHWKPPLEGEIKRVGNAGDHRVMTDGGTSPDDTERCACGGEHPEWTYHHPSACGETAQAFATLADVHPDEAWNRPRTLETDADRAQLTLRGWLAFGLACALTIGAAFAIATGVIVP